jgi:hypothetical protein
MFFFFLGYVVIKRYTRVRIVEHLIVLPCLLDLISFYDLYHILGVINEGGNFIAPNFLVEHAYA